MKIIQILLNIFSPTKPPSVELIPALDFSNETHKAPCNYPAGADWTGNPFCMECGRYWRHPAHFADVAPYPRWIDSDDTAFASIFWVDKIERPTELLKNSRDLPDFHWITPALFHDNMVEISYTDMRIWPIIVHKRQINAAVKLLAGGKLYPGWRFSLWEGGKCVAVGEVEKKDW